MSACSRTPQASDVYENLIQAVDRGELPQARDAVQSALARPGRTPQATLDLRLLQVEILLQQGNNAEAEQLLASIPEPSAAGPRERWLVGRAEAAWKLRRDAPTAFGLLEQIANPVSREGKFKGPLLRANILLSQGHTPEAEAAFVAVSAAADPFYKTAALLNLGRLRMVQQHWDQSLEYSLPALEAAEKAQFGRVAGLLRNNIGIAYYWLGDLDRAQENQDRSIARLRQVGDRRNLEDALAEAANIASARRDFPRAEQLNQEAYSLASALHLDADAQRWAANNADVLIEQKKWDQAELWNNRSQGVFARMNAGRIAAGRGRLAESLQLLTAALKDADIPFLQWDTHLMLAETYTDMRRFDKADREYELAMGVMEEIRDDIARSEFKFTFQERSVRFFRQYVDLLVQQGNTTRALQVVEYSRARVLAEKLGRPVDSISAVGLPALQKLAAANQTALVSYWLAPKRSFAWVIQASGIQMVELPTQDRVAAAVRTYRALIEQQQRDPVASNLPQGEALSALILKPVVALLGNAERVTIVPDGELHALNFETLPSPSGDRYWIEDREIAVAPALSVLSLQSAARRTPRLLLVGAPNAVDPAYPALPGAETELSAIQTRFPAQSESLTGAQATPGAFLAHMPEQFSMIHFAAHAEPSPRDPLGSAIILSKEGARYKLYASDITGLHLTADLVTVSACHSAGARAYSGEGLVGFAWAFLQSGAHHVIAGLWDVSDSSTAQLMDTLYVGIASGKRPAAALRAAKLALLHGSGPFKKPFYWAPYQTYVR